MFAKEREISQFLRALEALNRRLPAEHPKKKEIQKVYNINMAGFKGEEAISFYLRTLDLKKFTIINDLRLNNGHHYFQIDTLILTTEFALILEVKNFAGKLIFDPKTNQFIRIQDNIEESFRDPISQAESHQYFLKKWMEERHFTSLPIEYLVVISGDRTIYEVKTENPRIYNKICHAFALKKRIYKLESTYNQEITSKKELMRLSRTLIKNHHPLVTNILEKYEITPTELLTGVLCEKCQPIAMTYQSGKWRCPNCEFSSKLSHFNALVDYYLLVNPAINNAELRRFLHVNSIHKAYHLLMLLQLPTYGEKKNRLYQLHPIYEKKSLVPVLGHL